MDATPAHTRTGPLSRAISAEILAIMARRRISGMQLSREVGLSQNYIAKRLRDEAPFTITDLEQVCDALGVDFTTVVTEAVNHLRIYGE